MKAKCYACDERIDRHNRCRKRACRAQLEKRIKKYDWCNLVTLYGKPTRLYSN